MTSSQTLDIDKNSRKEKLKLSNLLWRLKVSFSDCNGEVIRVTRLKSDTEYLSLVLSCALSQKENATVKQIAIEIIKLYIKHGTDEEKLAVAEILANQKNDFSVVEDSSSSKMKINTFLPNPFRHFTRYKGPMLGALAVIVVSVLINSFWPTASVVDSNGAQIQVKESVMYDAHATTVGIESHQKNVNNGVTALAGAVNRDVEPNKDKSPYQARMLMRIHGSNTVGENLAPKLIVSYLKTLGAETITIKKGKKEVEKTITAKLPGRGWVKIEVHAHGSSTAFKDLKTGTTDIGMSSRKIKPGEVGILKKQLGDMTSKNSELVVGLDGLAIIVHPSNPINDLTIEQVASLFSGKVANWSELGIDKGKVNIYARDNNSGTWDTFKNLVLKKYNGKLAANAKRFESSSELSDLVANDPQAIGFIGLPYVRRSKLLAIADDAGTRSILPTRFTVGTEDYPLARRLYLYVPVKQTAFIRNWVNYALSKYGQDIVRKVGFISQNISESKPKLAATAPKSYKKLVVNASRLSLNFRFRPGSKRLDNKSIRDIARLTDYLAINHDKQLLLLGFADNIGAEQNNKMLSLQRARKVESSLQRYGVFPQYVTGFGEKMAVASNSTAAGREKNRRVEAWVF